MPRMWQNRFGSHRCHGQAVCVYSLELLSEDDEGKVGGIRMSYGWEEDGFIEEAMIEACGTTNIWTFIDEFNRLKKLLIILNNVPCFFYIVLLPD